MDLTKQQRVKIARRAKKFMSNEQLAALTGVKPNYARQWTSGGVPSKFTDTVVQEIEKHDSGPKAIPLKRKDKTKGPKIRQVNAADIGPLPSTGVKPFYIITNDIAFAKEMLVQL